MTDTSPRVGVITERGAFPLVYRCNGIEFEDVICASDDADLIPARSKKTFSEGRFDRRGLRRLGKVVDAALGASERVERPVIERDYDVLFLGVTGAEQLHKYRPYFAEWRDRSRLLVCYVEEVWESWIEHGKLIAPLQEFDFVFLGCSGSVRSLSRAISRPVGYLSPGIDMVRYCPFPNAPHRSIDVRAMGRRSAQTHAALVEWARSSGSTYLFDTHVGVHLRVQSYLLHRDHQADVLKRSRYFLVNPAKVDRDFETLGQQEVGLRFFEGAGAGAVLLGQSPRCAAFTENFDWPDAVIEMPYGSSEAADIIRALDAQPERLSRIRRNNVINCLERHDWSQRWRFVLRQIGMEAHPAALERQRRLTELAAQIAEADPAVPVERLEAVG